MPQPFPNSVTSQPGELWPSVGDVITYDDGVNGPLTYVVTKVLNPDAMGARWQLECKKTVPRRTEPTRK